MENKKNETNTKTSLTLLIAAGRVPVDLMEFILGIVKKYDLEIYLTDTQNIRLNGISSSVIDELKNELSDNCVAIKQKGQFPLPRVCVGKPYCNFGLIDTGEISELICKKFSSRKGVKPKFKIAVSACTLGCSGAKITDIGVEATGKGYNVFVGGKGGVAPKAGVKIKKNVDVQEMLETLEVLVDFHDRKTRKKQRMYKLLNLPDFPFNQDLS